MGGNEVVEVDDAAGLGEIAQTVPLDGIDVIGPTAGGDVLHRLGEFLAVRHADDLERDAGFLFPQFLDGRRTGREGLRQLANGAVGQAEHDTLGRLAGSLHFLDRLDGAAFRRIGAVLVALGALETGRAANHARRQRIGRIGAAWTDEARGYSCDGNKAGRLSSRRQKTAPRHAQQIGHQ